MITYVVTNEISLQHASQKFEYAVLCTLSVELSFAEDGGPSRPRE